MRILNVIFVILKRFQYLKKYCYRPALTVPLLNKRDVVLLTETKQQGFSNMSRGVLLTADGTRCSKLGRTVILKHCTLLFLYRPCGFQNILHIIFMCQKYLTSLPLNKSLMMECFYESIYIIKSFKYIIIRREMLKSVVSIFYSFSL